MVAACPYEYPLLFQGNKHRPPQPLSCIPIVLPGFRIIGFAAFHLLRTEEIEPVVSSHGVFDSDDAMFIEYVICGGAKVVISNDRSLTKLHEYVTDEEGK
ncbi:hypothetical protein ACH33_11250 [Aneurinibacillus sp. XH2]|nr:hypothetical protein ACH33_11250 [Aneurinibacillus sp. XH2]